jgi:adenine deaminase
VIAYEEGGGTIVNILDPHSMANLISEPGVQAVMGEARSRLKRVFEALNR